MEIPDDLLVHTVTVEPFLGSGSKGDVYGPSVTVPSFVDDTRKMVRNPDGDEVVSEATIIAKLDQSTKFPPKSRVLLPSGRAASVILTKRHDDGNLGAPQHLEVNVS